VEHLYKVVSVEQWEASKDSVVLGQVDSEFIHLSKGDQLERITTKFWRGVERYVVLTIDPDKLPGKLVLEANREGGDKYYHLYNGAIPKEAVLHVESREI